MSKPLIPALAQFVAATAGRNMTKAAYAAVSVGVLGMTLLTVNPAYEMGHRWVDVLLWACLAYFVFEWLVRLRHMARTGRLALYMSSAAGLVDALGALAVPVALVLGVEPKTAWLLSVLWVLKVIPGIPGLRQLRRVLVLESGPLVSVLVIFLMVVFLASVAEYFLERDVQPQTFGSVPAALWWAVVTLTTVGYGDVTPITTAGKILGAVITVLGVGLAALPAGILASGLANELNQRREMTESQFRNRFIENELDFEQHVEEIEKIRREIGLTQEQAQMVIKEIVREQELHASHLHAPNFCPHCGHDLKKDH